MPNIQIKNVRPETHAVFRRRAAEAGQSLQEYLRRHLEAEAARPTAKEAFAMLEGQTQGSISVDEIVQMIREDRDNR